MALKNVGHKDVTEGDTRFMPPELLSDDFSQLQQGDIFSLGATMLSLALGRDLPQSGPEWVSLRQNRIPALPATFSPAFSKLIESMMRWNPSARPAVATLLEHPLLRSESEQALADLQMEVEQLRKSMKTMAPMEQPRLERRFTF